MTLRVNKSTVTAANREDAVSILNKLRMGNRLFGNTAQGLKDTMAKLEKDHREAVAGADRLAFALNDSEYKTNIARLKAGIKGEETLAEYFERVVKWDARLQDLIVFTSLSAGQDTTTKEDQLAEKSYIPDSDFLVLYGSSVLILDAKNIRTSPDIPIYVEGNEIKLVGGKTLIEVHPSTFVWSSTLRSIAPVHSISGATVIVNESGATVWKNAEWHASDIKPMHIAELRDYLLQWIEGKDPTVDLNLLTEISKTQIRKEKSSLDLSGAAKLFGI